MNLGESAPLKLLDPRGEDVITLIKMNSRRRMLTWLATADRRGAALVHINPLIEAASRRTIVPPEMAGTLTGRTADPADPLGTATATLLPEGRRRLAVVDDSGRLLGLLCLKKDGTGYCSDEGS